jgi:proline iminopeptidase
LLTVVYISLTPGHSPNRRYEDAEFRFRFARLVRDYWRHAAFLDDGQLTRNATRLIGIPGILIHGRFDVSAPLETAWRLAKRWTTSRLLVLDDAGHGGGNDFMPFVRTALAEFGAM